MSPLPTAALSGHRVSGKELLDDQRADCLHVLKGPKSWDGSLQIGPVPRSAASGLGAQKAWNRLISSERAPVEQGRPEADRARCWC